MKAKTVNALIAAGIVLVVAFLGWMLWGIKVIVKP